jgi:hypothetical protein
VTWPGWENYVPKSRDSLAPPTGPRREVAKGAPRVKGAKVCWVDPVTRLTADAATEGWERFQSRREAQRWLVLLAEQDANRIRGLRRQVAYPLNVVRPDGHIETIARWTADFVYEELCAGGAPGHSWWRAVVEDSKGFKTEMYRRSRKHFQAQYGIAITET